MAVTAGELLASTPQHLELDYWENINSWPQTRERRAQGERNLQLSVGDEIEKRKKRLESR